MTLVYLCFLPIIVFAVILSLSLKELRIQHAILACIIGLIALFPIEVLQIYVTNQMHFSRATFELLLKCLVINGLIEETAKMVVLFIIPSKKISRLTFFYCAALSGLALGCYELFIYQIMDFKSQNGFLRFMTAVVLHASCAGLSGFFVYSVKTKKFSIFPFICAVLFHGAYDYFAGFSRTTPFFYFSFITILFAIVECRSIYLASMVSDQNQNTSPRLTDNGEEK